MTTLIWLAASSLVWGAALWFAATLLQRHNDLSGRARQWIWRGATLLLIAPWIAAPVVGVLGLGLASSDTVAAASVLAAPALPADLAAASAVDTGYGTTAAIKSESGLLSWLKGLAFGEMLVLAIMLGWIVRFIAAQLSTRTLLGILATSRIAEDGLALRSLSAWSERLRLRRQPELRIVAPGVSPFSFGVLKPVICLPKGLEHKLGNEALDLVVGHECLHVSRGDGWRRPLERICADIFWFNPFAWAMRRELDMARELACDEGVVEMSSARRAYARTLRDVAGMTAGLSGSLPAASMSLAGSGRSLMMRVQRTLEHAKRKPARVALMAAVALGAAGACTSVGQAMLATPAAKRGTEVVTLAPAEVTFAGKLDLEGWYVELKQAGGEIGKAKARTCLVEAWRFDKLNVVTGQMLEAGAIVGTGRPVVSSDLVCRDMITGAEYALDPNREPGGMRHAPVASGQPREIRAPMQMRVAQYSGQGPAEDAMIRLESTATTGSNKDCEIEIISARDVTAKAGDLLEEGALIGRPWRNSVRIVECDLDAAAMKWLAIMPPKSPQPIRTSYELPDQVAPLAPPSPPAPATPLAQSAAEAPEAPRAPDGVTPVAPLGAPKPTPQASQLTLPAPVAAPAPPVSPVSGVAPTPRVTPAPQPAPVAPPRTPLAPPASAQPELITVRAPFAARVLAIEPAAASGAVGVRLQQMASRAHPVPADGCIVFYSYIENPRVAVAQMIFEGWVIGFGKPGAAEMAASCEAPIPAILGTPSPQPEVRIANTSSPVIDGPARFTSGYGFRMDPFTQKSAWHDGIDIAKFEGATIRAPGAGVVTFAGVKAEYGMLVELDLGDGFQMRFGHLEEMKVKLGDKVKAGDIVGTMGSSGPSTGSHLHFEVYRNGKTVDPMLIQGLTPIGPG